MHPIEVILSPLGWALRNRRADEAASIANAPELRTNNHFPLTSPSFADGEVIPARHCGPLIGKNLSPGLQWAHLPDGTIDLLFVLEDLDSPGRVPRIHTVAEFPPKSAGLPEGAMTAENAAVRFLPGIRGGARYLGPRPLPGHGTHRYRFHLYALDAAIDVTSINGTDQLRSAVKGHVLASGVLTGVRTS